MRKSLKAKFTIAFILTFLVSLIMFMGATYTYEILISRMEEYSTSLSQLNEFRSDFSEFNNTVSNYLETNSNDSLEHCQKLSVELDKICTDIYDKYYGSDDTMQSSLVSAILTYYNAYIVQIQDLVNMENRTEAVGLYITKYSKNGDAIIDYIEKLISYNYKISTETINNTHNKVQLFRILNYISFSVLLIILGILFNMIYRGVITPIKQLAKQSQQIANYNFDIENIEVKSKDEIFSLVKMFNHMKEKLKLMFDSNIKNLQMAEELLVQIQGDENLEQLVKYQKNLNEEMFREANIDHLTHLMNQNAFVHCVNENIKSIGANELCALFVIDIDNFTSINATLGDGADEVLKYSANELNNLFKDCGFIARWNRDVFVAFISGLPNEEFSHQKCKEINSVLNIHFRHKKKYHPVTASIGVSLCSNPVSAEFMFENAERELKTVKLAGKNGYHIARFKR